MDKQYLLQTSGSQFHLHSQEEQYIGIALGVKRCNRSTEGRRTGVLYSPVVDLLLEYQVFGERELHVRISQAHHTNGR
jgi:hypothetical protein